MQITKKPQQILCWKIVNLQKALFKTNNRKQL